MFEDKLREYSADPIIKNLYPLLLDARRRGITLFSLENIHGSGGVTFYLFDKDEKIRVDECNIFRMANFGEKSVFSIPSKKPKDIKKADSSFGSDDISGVYYIFNFYTKFGTHGNLTDDPLNYLRKNFHKYSPFFYNYGDNFLEIPPLVFDWRKVGAYSYLDLKDIWFPENA